MRQLIFFCAALIGIAAQPLFASPQQIVQTAQELFPDMPKLRLVARIADHCGADDSVNPYVAFCTTKNVIFYRIRPEGQSGEEARADAYRVSQALGHAVQVRHGIADIALREIRARRDEEALLRGWVTRQAACIGGAIYARSGLPPLRLTAIFDEDPMTDRYWGRDPLRVGPRVAIGLEVREKWFALGQTEGFAACTPGEFDATLILKALR